MKQLYLVLVLFLTAGSVLAQSPEKAIGIRAGVTPGIEYRVFSGDLISYKALLSTRQRGLQFTGMKEFHNPEAFDFVDDFTFIYGFGAHIGFESWNVYHYPNPLYPDYWERERRTGPVAGLDGLLAVEYTVPQIPLVGGIEVKPYFNLFGRNFFQLVPYDFAFTVKYTF